MTKVIVKGRRLAAENGRWRVYYDHLVDNKNNDVADYLVVEGRHSRADQITGIAVLPILDDKLVLIRAYRHALGRELWEAPRGFIDVGETPAQAALRELTEETGLHCAPANLVELGSYAPEPATFAARGLLYAAMCCQGTPHAADDELGLNAISAFDRAEIAGLVAAGAIEEAGTLILFYRFCSLQS